MDTQFRGAYRQFTVDSIFSDDLRVPERKILWKTKFPKTNGLADPENEDLIQIASGGINIVSSRDARRNVRLSLRIAMDIAEDGLRVLYVNSYAGLALLRESLQTELARSKEERAMIRGEVVKEIEPAVKGSGDAEWRSRFQIIDCKMGMWGGCSRAIGKGLYQEKNVSYNSKEQVLTQYSDVIVLNSFELASVTYRQKLEMTTDIMRWRDKVPLTVVIFTQEVQAVMEAGLPVRGPLGLLTTSADTLSKVDQIKKGRNQPEVRNRPVHEQVLNTAIKLFYSTSGNLDSVEYPKGYKGRRYDFGFFPQRVTDPIPDGIQAVQLVGRGKI
jgi:hypothetical protein